MTFKITPTLRRIAAPLLGLTLIVSGATACGSDDNSGTEASGHLPSGEGHTSYPLDLTTEFGSTTLDERPDRIVAYSGLGPELALSLGITPVASSDWEKFSPFLSEQGADDIDTILEPVDNNVPIEAISAQNPDLIVVNTTEQKDVDQLSKVAPVLAYGYSWGPDGTDWQHQLADLAEATDLQDKADDVVRTHDEAIQKVKDKHPEYAEHTANFISDKGGSVYVESFGGSPGEEFFTRLGFRKWEHAGDFPSASDKVSGERYGDLGADVMFIYDPAGGLPTLSQSAAYRGLTAVKNDLAFDLVSSDTDPFPMVLAVGLRSPAPLTDAWLAERVSDLLGDKLK